MVEDHIEELRRKHSNLGKEIEEELLHPSADFFKINELKKRKLALKDTIESFLRQCRTSISATG